MALFNLYDNAGDGKLSTKDFVEKVLPPDFAKRRESLAAQDSPAPTDYEGPRVSVPPGFGGHLPGNERRFGMSYGASALKAWTTQEPKTPGVYREVPIPKWMRDGGSFPGHMCDLTPITTPMTFSGVGKAANRPQLAVPKLKM